MKNKLFLIGFMSLFALISCRANGGDIPTSTKENETTFSFKNEALTLHEDETYQLEYETNYKKAVAFSSSDKTVASVSSTGLIIAKKEGKSTILGSVETASASFELTVLSSSSESQAGIHVDAKSLTLALEDKDVSVKAYFYHLEGDVEVKDPSVSLDYKANNSKIASIDSEGKITPIASGKTDVVISHDEISETVSLDIYDERISKATEWFNIFNHGGDKNYRAYVSADLDFLGIPYTGFVNGHDHYPIFLDDPAVDNPNSKLYPFSGEINGFGHRLSNIVFAKQEYQPMIYDKDWKPIGVESGKSEGTQSLFGQCVGSYIHDLSFENVAFTGNYQAILVRCTHESLNDELYGISKFENIYVKAQAKEYFYGLFVGHYGNYLKNIFLDVTKIGGGAWSSSSAIADQNYNWFDGVFSGVIVYSDSEGLKTFANPSSSIPLDLSSTLVTTSVMEAAYLANNYFDPSIWELRPSELPKLRQGGH